MVTFGRLIHRCDRENRDGPEHHHGVIIRHPTGFVERHVDPGLLEYLRERVGDLDGDVALGRADSGRHDVGRVGHEPGPGLGRGRPRHARASIHRRGGPASALRFGRRARARRGGSGIWASHPSAIGYRRQGYTTGGSHGGSGSGTITRREVERFVLSRRRRAANCAREAATLSERERVDGSLQTDAGNGGADNGIGCPQPRMGRYRTARRVNAGNGDHVIASVFFEPWEGDTEPTMIGPIAPDKDADLLTTKETKYTKEIKILEAKHTVIVYRAGRTRGIDMRTEFSPHH